MLVFKVLLAQILFHPLVNTALHPPPSKWVIYTRLGFRGQTWLGLIVCHHDALKARAECPTGDIREHFWLEHITRHCEEERVGRYLGQRDCWVPNLAFVSERAEGQPCEKSKGRCHSWMAFYQMPNPSPLCLCLLRCWRQGIGFPFSPCLLMWGWGLMQKLAPKYKIVSNAALAKGLELGSAFRLCFNCCLSSRGVECLLS